MRCDFCVKEATKFCDFGDEEEKLFKLCYECFKVELEFTLLWKAPLKEISFSEYSMRSALE